MAMNMDKSNGNWGYQGFMGGLVLEPGFGGFCVET